MQLPTVDILSDTIWRVYYSARDRENKSHISYFDVEAGNPCRVLYSHDTPILPLGKLGTFDDAGMMPSSIVTIGDVKYLYYTREHPKVRPLPEHRLGWLSAVMVAKHLVASVKGQY